MVSPIFPNPTTSNIFAKTFLVTALQPNHFEFQGWLVSILPTNNTTWLFSCLPPNPDRHAEPLGNDRFYSTAEEAIVAAKEFIDYQIAWGGLWRKLEEWVEADKITAAEYHEALKLLSSITHFA